MNNIINDKVVGWYQTLFPRYHRRLVIVIIAAGRYSSQEWQQIHARFGRFLTSESLFPTTSLKSPTYMMGSPKQIIAYMRMKSDYCYGICDVHNFVGEYNYNITARVLNENGTIARKASVAIHFLTCRYL